MKVVVVQSVPKKLLKLFGVILQKIGQIMFS